MNILLIPLLLCSAVLFTTLTIGISIAWVWIMGYAAYELVISAIRLTHYMKGKASNRLFLHIVYKEVDITFAAEQKTVANGK